MRAERRRNLLACETGIGICDKSLLTSSETEKVADIEKEQNQLNCETGAETCEYSLLNPTEAVRVHILEREHNLLACQTADLQIGASLASALGRRMRLSRDRMRLIAPVTSTLTRRCTANLPGKCWPSSRD